VQPRTTTAIFNTTQNNISQWRPDCSGGVRGTTAPIKGRRIRASALPFVYKPCLDFDCHKVHETQKYMQNWRHRWLSDMQNCSAYVGSAFRFSRGDFVPHTQGRATGPRRESCPFRFPNPPCPFQNLARLYRVGQKK